MAQQATAPAARRSPPRVVEVLRVSDLSPHYRRITLGGPALADYPAGMAGAHLKLFLRRPGQAELALPSFGPNGPAWPPREQRPFVRTYTIRRHDAAAGELDLEFVLHGDNGPASAWAAAAKPGDQVGISGPGRREEQVLSADWRLLAGDLSALPAIAAYLEALPADARGVALSWSWRARPGWSWSGCTRTGWRRRRAACWSRRCGASRGRRAAAASPGWPARPHRLSRSVICYAPSAAWTAPRSTPCRSGRPAWMRRPTTTSGIASWTKPDRSGVATVVGWPPDSAHSPD